MEKKSFTRGIMVGVILTTVIVIVGVSQTGLRGDLLGDGSPTNDFPGLLDVTPTTPPATVISPTTPPTVVTSPTTTTRSASSNSSTSSSSSSSCNQTPPSSDLSVILDKNKDSVKAGENITYIVKVKNVGEAVTNGATVTILRNDMTYIQSSVFCYVQQLDPTYVRCTVPSIASNQLSTFTVTMKVASGFTCIDSTGGRPVFAFIGSGNRDNFTPNNMSNIINIMPVCQ